jgi:hypothetical protein
MIGEMSWSQVENTYMTGRVEIHFFLHCPDPLLSIILNFEKALAGEAEPERQINKAKRQIVENDRYIQEKSKKTRIERGNNDFPIPAVCRKNESRKPA